jgi:excisionase family DNA binding protein
MAFEFEELITTDEVAELFKFTPQHIRRLAERKIIPATRYGKEWRFRKSDLDRTFREACGIKPLAELETFPVIRPEPITPKRRRGRPTNTK